MLPHGVFLSFVILAAIFNVSVLGFSMYFCLKKIKAFILCIIYFFILTGVA